MCYERISTENQRFRSNEVSLTQTSCRYGRPSNHSSCHKIRVNVILCGIRNGHNFLSFCHKSHVRQIHRETDGRTERILIARPSLHSMQRRRITISRFISSVPFQSVSFTLTSFFNYLFSLHSHHSQRPSFFHCFVPHLKLTCST